MKQYPYWKPALIILVILLSALLVYPPAKKLKPGLDLAGGTILLYQVDVPEDAQSEAVVEQTIAALRKRVDPNGVRNLVWRPVAGNRIEIQMAMPSAETKKLRQAYIDAREELANGNISRGQIAAVVRLDNPEARAAAIANLAKGNALRTEALNHIVTAHDQLQKARQAYDEYNLQLKQAEEALQKIPADAKDAREENTKHQQELLAGFVPVTRAYNQATRAYNQAVDKLLATNIDPGQLDRILNLPPAPTKGKLAADAAKNVNYFEPALAKLKQEQPDRVQDIEKVVTAYQNYSKDKGALDDPNDLIALLRGSGVLEFRIAASRNLPDGDEYRRQLSERGPRGGDQPFRWFRIDDPSSFADTPSQLEAMEASPEAYFYSRGLIGQRYAGDYYVLLSNQPQSTLTKDKPGWQLNSARAQGDQNGFPAVGFYLNDQGGQYMSQLTGSHVGQPMAIVLDGRVISTPTINDRIGSSGIITGGGSGFSQKELQYMVRTLNAGSLSARLSEQPISIKTIGPGLGQDNLRHGMQAAYWAMGLITAVMVIYYFHWGLVAIIALALNILITLAAMSALQATFTLPGIAGIVLTIGMAIDANVLILERIREELERKADLKTALRLGYEKALSAIVDSNITSIITCVILYYTATADVKGFGLTLGLGIASSMFTALFFTHVVSELYLLIVKPRSAPMLPLVFPAISRALTPNINWIALAKPVVVFSVILTIASIGVTAYRGVDLLDIEFRSGTQISFDIKENQTLSLGEVRSRLDKAAEKAGIPELAGNRASVVTLGDTQVRDTQVYAGSFSISTLSEDSARVSNAIKDAFADVLETQRPISFTGIDAATLNDAPISPVTNATLGANINRPSVTDDVTDAVGGVVVVLENLSPPATIEAITSRVQQVQLQAEYADLGYRPFKVIGLDLATTQDGPSTLYSSVAVVAHDNSTNYLEDPRSFTTDEQGLAATQWQIVRTAMQIDTSLASVSNFSSQVSRTMQQQAIIAIVLSMVTILLYVWVRFGRLTYGLGGIVALIHDVIVTLGLVAMAGLIYNTPVGSLLMLSNFKIDLAMIAAFLTIVGFSINDTIVIFDRIRENRGRLSYASVQVINDSINQTLSRTIMTNGTTLISALSLYVLGGDGVHGFAFAMIIGCIVGSYSTIFIASPMLLFVKVEEPRTETSNEAPTADATA